MYILGVDHQKKPVRFWPAVVILLLSFLALAWVWLLTDTPRQLKNIRTAIILIWTFGLLFFWFLLFSRTAWRWRITVAALTLVTGIAASQLLVIRGVTGDLIPVIDWKWNAQRDLPPPSPAGINNPAGSNHLSGEFLAFMGEARDGKVHGNVSTNWIDHPPEILWKQPLGAAWSGFAIKDAVAVTQEQRGEMEYVVAYDLTTGAALWSHGYPARYSTTIAGEGPRATPTINHDSVFTLGATGTLSALNLRSGNLLWSRNALADYEGKLPDWGMASSPLVHNRLVIVSVGGSNARSLAAYDRHTGEPAWAAGEGGADYSSPILADLLGEKQILIFNTRGLVSHALSGAVLWTHPWKGGHPHISLPVVVGTNQVLLSSGYGTGAQLIQVEKAGTNWTTETVWKSMALKSKFGPVFVHDQHIYGLDDGILACVDLKTGQRRWKDGRYGHGQGLMVGGLLLLTAENGDLVLIQPNPEKLLELNRLTVFDEKTWNPPAWVEPYFLMRNHHQAACLKLYPNSSEQQKLLALSFAKPVSHQ